MNLDIYKESAKACGFYDIPLWSEDKPKPIFYDLFEWSEGLGFCEIKDKNSKTYSGELKEELFDTEEKKIYYLKGVFEDYSGSILDKNCIHFANSQNKVERCKKWIDEIARKYFLKDFITSGVIKHTIEYYIPIVNTVEIHPKVIEFIKNYK